METENVGRTGCLFVDKGGSGDQRLNLVLCNPTFPLQPSEGPQRALLRNYDETMLTMMTNRLMPTAMARSRPLTCRPAASSPQPPSTPPHTCCPEQTVVCVENSISRCFAKNRASQICCHTCNSPLFALKRIGDLPENVHQTRKRPILF